MLARIRSLAPSDCPILALRDARLLATGALWTVAALVVFGLVAAIIPNPVFGRQVPPQPFAYWVWIFSAPLMGLIMATYTTPTRPNGVVPIRIVAGSDAEASRGTVLGGAASLAAFLAIGCPVCNKVALLLLGASGAMTIYAPIQPFIGAASLLLLAGTLAWRLRIRARGGACAV